VKTSGLRPALERILSSCAGDAFVSGS